MQRFCFWVAFSGSLLASAAAQATPDIRLTPDGTIAGISGLADDTGCVESTSSVTVRSLQIDNGVLRGFRYADPEHGEGYANLDIDAVPPARRKQVADWLAQVIRPGARLRLGLKACGAAGRIEIVDAIAPAAKPPAAGGPSGPPGTITGRLEYPSDYIPAVDVCAEPAEGGAPICTRTKAALKATFRLRVPAGSYRVFARLVDAKEAPDFAGYKAYYSQMVRCGLHARCKDHTPIVVRVEPGKTVRDVRPADWYAK